MFGWFKSGGDDKTYSPGELRDALRKQDGAFVLVDVRENNEWAGGHIPGAIHVPLSRFATAAATIPKDRKIIFYCQSGIRSKKALNQARKLGLPADGHLGGGISDWRRHDLPVAR
ncbi:rhodanese-like domain-containing protein [Rhodoblastus sp.]|uniref:rhodanese-like domain-containing protein n=1 Tax=Rhodoblastus sp. TaxID=1962975 RepID=UPI0035AD822F